MKTLKEKIEVMQAAMDGKNVEYLNYDGCWKKTENPNWNWYAIDYRIKPEPKKIPLDESDITPTTWIRDIETDLTLLAIAYCCGCRGV